MGKRRPSGDGMVRKRDDGRWEGRIVVGHKANGAPIFRHVYAKTQKALTEKLHQSIECYQDVELTEDSRMTLGEWLDRWLAEYKDGTIRSGTLEGYRNYIENYIKPQLGGKQVSLITTQDVQRMYRRLKSGGRVREDAEGSKRLSDSTVRHIHTMLHGAMKAAVQAHIIPKNPTENATVPKSNYKPMQVLNEQELDTFLQAVQKDDIWREFFYTELMTGLRRGEICALMWRDFDAKAGTLGISRTLHSKGQGVYALGDTKTSKGNRTIILPESVAALLRARKKASISQWIFPHPTSPELPMNPGTAYRRLKPLLEEAGLPSIRFHDLRHTFATLTLQNGMDVKTLSAMLGHVSAATTLEIYTHSTSDMQHAAARKIDCGIGKAELPDEPAPQANAPAIVDFQPCMGKVRKPGTGCISQINDHLFEGRYSPTWIDGKKHARNVYAHTREECEEKLKVLIAEMKAELAELKRQKTDKH